MVFYTARGDLLPHIQAGKDARASFWRGVFRRMGGHAA
jgi:hypothetical protein